MIVYVDMDDVLCDFTTKSKIERELDPEIIYPQSQYGFFSSLSPLSGAIDAVKALLNSNKYDPYILTAPSVLNPLCYTEKRVWVEKHLGMEMVKRLVISPNKSLLKGDFLIDDHSTGCFQNKFEGELIHFGTSKFPDWKTVRNYLDL